MVGFYGTCPYCDGELRADYSCSSCQRWELTPVEKRGEVV